MKDMKNKIQTLKGFRDFLPEEKRKRDYITSKVKQVFERYGFEPLETPTLEYASLLLGKYGEEADRLVYTFTDKGKRKIGLRYDQTVPSARILAQYQNKLPNFFRRYQIQNVFRADKPQKGRYREFTQCDIDIFGTTSATADAEIIACTFAVFKEIGYPTIKLIINDRRILFDTFTQYSNSNLPTLSIIQTIDKLDKISEKDVIKELVKKGLTEKNAKKALKKIKSQSPTENLQEIIRQTKLLGVPASSIEFSPILARGLDYYTGMIFEVIIPEYPIGSFGGGGRYDNLIQDLGGPSIPAVGIAYGFDRMIEAAETLGLIPANITSTDILVTVFDESTQASNLTITKKLRSLGFSTQIYPNLDKLSKQLVYGDKIKAKYAVIQGPDEVKDKSIIVKKLRNRTQTKVSLKELCANNFK